MFEGAPPRAKDYSPATATQDVPEKDLRSSRSNKISARALELLQSKGSSAADLMRSLSKKELQFYENLEKRYFNKGPNREDKKK